MLQQLENTTKAMEDEDMKECCGGLLTHSDDESLEFEIEPTHEIEPESSQGEHSSSSSCNSGHSGHSSSGSRNQV